LTSFAVFLSKYALAGANISPPRPREKEYTYPGSLSVLFIEYAKCFPSDVNRSGR
jgi:hypothetical protein